VLSTKIDTTDTLQSAGERFVNNLKTWRSQNENGVIIATMGIGADGHIAGMFPGEYDVDFASDSWVVWYEVPPEINQYTKRITVTNTFLQTQVIEVILFATSTKARLLKPLMHVQTEQPQGPTAILKRLPSVTLYTDYNPDDGV
jgi:6-phosphogluconolactonase/glucosamine-6-phosphate isomerase/deaminase